MHVDKIIKRQTLTLLVIVITLITFISSLMYILFFEIDNYSESKNDFDISFCIDSTCDKSYYNYNNLIGVNSVDNKISLREINEYNNRVIAMMEYPYIFTIKNNISDSTIGIKFNFKKDYLNDNSYKKYIDSIYIAIDNEDSDLKVIRYNDIDGYILSPIEIKNNQTKKYYVWLWTENRAYTEKVYFPLSVELDVIK